MNENVLKISNLFIKFNNEVKRIHCIGLKEAFIISSFLLSVDELPNLTNVNEEDIELIKRYRDDFNKLTYSKFEMRQAFSMAYLNSLSETENYTVDTSPELIQIFLKEISELIYKNSLYTNINVLNPYGNIGLLSNLISIGGVIDEERLSVVVKDAKELTLAEALKNFTNSKYNVDIALPALNYNTDLIVSDPFFSEVNEALIFFADYTEYLSQDGFMVLNLNASFVRTRVFSDILEQYNLKLIMIVNSPTDLADGAIKSSIVILRHNGEACEFAQADMVSVKDIDGNIEVLKNIKDYLNKYLRGEENENNVN